jgi:hypothetical protein
MDFALEELARVAQLPSVRAVFIRPMFVEDRYLKMRSQPFELRGRPTMQRALPHLRDGSDVK